jgi:ABC-2 type transport system permease protein
MMDNTVTMPRAGAVRSMAAFVRQDFLTQASYRVQMLLSIGSIVVMMIPVYFIAKALNPLMVDSIQNQGGEYFGFLVVGLAIQVFLGHVTTALPGAVGSGIRTGTLEALFATPNRIATLLGGMTAYKVLWGLVQVVVLLGTGWAFGAHLVAAKVLPALLIVILIALAYLPFGLLAAAGILAFRTAGPLVSVVSVGSVLLGGVYFPTQAIPSSIESLSAIVPLTYGLRALRKILLEGFPIAAVTEDIVFLLGFIVLTGALAAWSFAAALRYARRSGSLAQY